MSETDGAWQSYLQPGTNVLRNVPGIRDQLQLNFYERVTAGEVDRSLRERPPPERFDLPYLQRCHRELFGNVYPFAGELRYVGMHKSNDPDRPFVVPELIRGHFDALTAQLHREGELRRLSEPRQWADRAGYYWAEANRCHPFREGNGRSTRTFLHQLARAAGHQLDWDRIDRDLGHERINAASRAGQDNDQEPLRALLQYASTGTIERATSPRDQLDRLDKALAEELFVDTHIRAGVARPEAAGYLASVRSDVERELRRLRQATEARTQAPKASESTRQPSPQRTAGYRDASGERLSKARGRSRDDRAGYTGRGCGR